MSKPRGKNWVEVSRAAIRHNVAALREHVGPDVKFMAVVKSNAYGHGTALVVKSLMTRRQVDWFGVDSFEEAVAVRSAGAKQPILILGYVPEDQLKSVVRAGFSVAAYDPEMIEKLNELAGSGQPAKIHLKLETGTSRQGVLPQDLPKVIAALRKCEHVWLEGVYTHYADVEDTADSSYAMKQLAAYNSGLLMLAEAGFEPHVRHTAASGAAILHGRTRFDMVRAGIAIYGQWPSATVRQKAPQKLRLQPAMTVKATVAQVKRLPVGTPVSYGLTEVLKRDSKLAVVTAGYYDGYDRSLSSTAHVLVRGKRARVVGRVCMNMIIVDVTDIRGVKRGDEVVLLGRQGKEEVSAEELGELSGTINYEVVTRINPLLPRIQTK